jgi:hypothetical protein
MYFPIMRGKQYELLALREFLTEGGSDQNVLPVVEPVRKRAQPLLKLLDVFHDVGGAYIVALNPTVGHVQGRTEVSDALLAKVAAQESKGIAAINVTSGSYLHELARLVEVSSAVPVAFFHQSGFPDAPALASVASKHDDIRYHLFSDNLTGREYRHTFDGAPRVFVQDPFVLMRNADYPEEEFFSDFYVEHRAEGYNGFGDYTIVGADYREGGGPAYAVAVHLTYEKQKGQIWVRHFVSDSKETAVNPGGKFREALTKLVAFVDQHPELRQVSSAVADFEDLHQRMHFPGLGVVKKLSMRHHMSLMASLQ